MSWFDSHCHLDACGPEPDAVVAEAQAAGVTRMVTIGTDLESSTRAIQIASRIDAVSATVGIDPHCLDAWGREAIAELRGLASSDQVVAVGEIGLDYFHDRSPRELQREAFEQQLDLARSLRMAVVLHVRDAFDEVMSIVSNAQLAKPIVFHCFSATVTEARDALDAGGYISFAGNVTFKSAEPLRDAAKVVPLDRMLIETDSPFLSPVPKRGRENRPANLVHVGEAIAQARSTHIQAIREATFSNASFVFDR